MAQLVAETSNSSPIRKSRRIFLGKSKKKNKLKLENDSNKSSNMCGGTKPLFIYLVLIIQLVVIVQMRVHQYDLQKLAASIRNHNITSPLSADSYQHLQSTISASIGNEKQQHHTAKAVAPAEKIGEETILLDHSRNSNSSNLLVNYGDTIYLCNDWNGSPIVIEEYKLIFFATPKIGCTVWLQLLRRMMHLKDWHSIDINPEKLLPWNPEYNGLSYLYHYNISYVNYIMTHPNWTRAIFVRDPKERFLSAYLDKVLRDDKYLIQKFCQFTDNNTCLVESRKSLDYFLHDVVHYCHNVHWTPQTFQMSNEQWSYINFIGHLDNIRSDTERLLRQLNVWEVYGSSGWGKRGIDPIFSAQIGDENSGRRHGTNAKRYMRSYITKELEIDLNEYYEMDYNNPFMNLTKKKLF